MITMITRPHHTTSRGAINNTQSEANGQQEFSGKNLFMSALDALHYPHDAHKALHVMEELQESRRLQRDVRVLCWVLISPKEHVTLGPPVRDTWGRRCNKLVFMSTKDDPSIGAVDCGSREGYTKLWNKTRSALIYIYKNFLYDYDWFLKADTNTYVVVDNLRYFLADRDTEGELYYGMSYRTPWGRYNTGGAGHVMGREAVRRFVERAIPNHDICKPQRSKGEDVGMGKCLGSVGVRMGDVRDEAGRSRFFQHHPASFIAGPRALARFELFKTPQGFRNCCSSSVVTFHKINTEDMYLFHYLLYTLNPHGHHLTLPIHARTIPLH